MKLKSFLWAGVVLSAICLFLTGWFAAKLTLSKDPIPEVPTSQVTAEVTADTTTEATEPAAPVDAITVALYPHLPDLYMAQNTLAVMWADLEPDVKLEFIYWDCYDDPYPHGIDVIVYDAVFLDYLVENNLVDPLDLDTLEDTTGILPYTMEGARYDGDLYGLPVLACSNYLIHYTEDEEMMAVQNFEQLYNLLSQRKSWYASDGLQVNVSDFGSSFYLDALIDYTGTYTTYQDLSALYPPVTEVLDRLYDINSLIPEPAGYIRGRDFRTRFAKGEGSACYSFSESLYDMKNILDQLTIRPIAFFEGENIPIYYTDIASIGSHVTAENKYDLCMKLVNLLGSVEYQAQLCFGNGDVQYLLPAREQVYLAAMEQYPMYETLYILATNENNRISRFGSDVYKYFGKDG